MKQKAVIEEIEGYVNSHLSFAKDLKALSKEQLHKKPENDGWNILQCIEHLNRYGDFYLTEIESKINNAKPLLEDKDFKSGFWGKLFTKMMLPKKGMIKMKTFADKNPNAEDLNIEVIDKFIEQQQKWLVLINKCSKVDLNKNSCRLTLPLLNMNMGSTLQFVIYHNERHVVQAKKLL